MSVTTEARLIVLPYALYITYIVSKKRLHESNSYTF